MPTAWREAGVVSEPFAADAYHVAVAVVCGADVIVSWNFRHIVRRKTRDIVNMVNTLRGYAHIERSWHLGNFYEMEKEDAYVR